MVAGIPGTGIGGLYYLMLTFMMPLKEAYVTYQGKSSVRRWMDIALQWFNAIGIVGSIWATGWLLGVSFIKAKAIGYSVPEVSRQFTNMWSLTSACLAFGILGTVVLTVLIMSLVLPKRPAHTTLAQLDK
jgi:phage shock protein PspC (stress-responsive transcriptional regulator)